METNFTFLISPADAGTLEGQVSRALEKRVEPPRTCSGTGAAGVGRLAFSAGC